MEFFDTHAHLAMLEHAPLADVLQRAGTAEIKTLVTVSVDEKSWALNRAVADGNSNVYYSLGLHPHDAKDWLDCKARMDEELKLPSAKKCIAIGETGLDFHYNKSPRENQIQAFEEQLILAKKLDLPVIIHCREAFADTYTAIKKIGLSSRGGVMHCFTGNTQDAKNGIDVGLKISFSGILTFKNAVPIQEAAKAIPLKEIVIETDCPFLAPIPFRGKPNEPALLIETAKFLASLRNIPLEDLAQATTTTAKHLFNL